MQTHAKAFLATKVDKRLDATDPAKTAGDWPVALTVVMVMAGHLSSQSRSPVAVPLSVCQVLERP